MTMPLTMRQRERLDAWLADNMDMHHTATWAANNVAPLLGFGESPLEWDVLHPLASTVRERCNALGIRVKVISGAADDASYEKSCKNCGIRFTTTAPNAAYCPTCRRKRK